MLGGEVKTEFPKEELPKESYLVIIWTKGKRGLLAPYTQNGFKTLEEAREYVFEKKPKVYEITKVVEQGKSGYLYRIETEEGKLLGAMLAEGE